MTWYVDCTYTRLQAAEVGITRVVRGLARGLREADPAIDVRFAAYHSEGFRRAPSASAEPAGGTSGSLYRLSERPELRHAVKALTPIWLQEWVWGCFSRFTYSRLADRLPRADIGADDIVVLCDASWGYDVWSCVDKAAKQGARIVTMVHDLIPITHPEFCAPVLTLIFENWLKEALRRSDALLCNSVATRREVEHYCRARSLQCPPAAAFRLGGDLPRAAAVAAPIAQATRDIAGRRGLFLSVGTLEPRKNHVLLLDAFDECWKRGSDVTLAIVGRPADGTQATLARIRAHAQLGRKLFLLTVCSDAELDFLYRRARAVVLASLVEGFGLPLAEARQHGCEVFASRIPAFEELADAGVQLFAPRAAGELAALVSQAAATPAPPQAAATAAFTWRDSARQFMDGIARTSGSRSP